MRYSPIGLYVLVLLAVFLLAIANADAGELNEAVTQDTLSTTVCTSGYVQSIRPPSSYTQAWEKQNGGGVDTVVDHKTPLCAGGNPTDYENYQLQLKPESYRKDVAERLVCKLLCEGRLNLKEAQRMFWQ